VKEVGTRREAIAAALVGLALAAIVWGPVLLRPLGSTQGVDLRAFSLPDTPRSTHVRTSLPPARVAKLKPAKPVDINRADVTALQTLPGVGPTLAKRIVSHRQARGPFEELEQVMEVEGIGAKRYEKLKPWIEVR